MRGRRAAMPRFAPKATLPPRCVLDVRGLRSVLHGIVQLYVSPAFDASHAPLALVRERQAEAGGRRCVEQNEPARAQAAAAGIGNNCRP